MQKFNQNVWEDGVNSIKKIFDFHFIKEESSRDYYIDFIKGLTVLSVIFIHTCFWSGQTYYIPEYMRTLCLLWDVPVFFLCAGMTIALKDRPYSIYSICFKFAISFAILAFLDDLFSFNFTFSNTISTLLLNGRADHIPLLSGSYWFVRVFIESSIIAGVLIKFCRSYLAIFTIAFFCYYILIFYNIIPPQGGMAFNAFYAGIILCAYLFSCNSKLLEKHWKYGCSLFCFLFALCCLYMSVEKYGWSFVLNLQNSKFPVALPYIGCSFLLFSFIILFYSKKYKFPVCICAIGCNSLWFYVGQCVGGSALFLILPHIHCIWFVKLTIAFICNLLISLVSACVLQLIYNLLCAAIGIGSFPINEKAHETLKEPKFTEPNKKNINYILFLPIFLVAIFVYIFLVYQNNYHEMGESRHYVTSTLTLLNKGGISFNQKDIDYAESIFGKYAVHNFQRYNFSDQDALHEYATKEAKNKDFIGRSFYWGTYSFLCIPVFWICRTFHLFQDNMFIAFKISNIIMLLIPLLAVIFLLNGDKIFKFNMLLVTAVTPAAQYLGWASAEICIYMFVMLYLIFLHNRQYYRSALCLAFGATLNYCLFPLGVYLLYHFLKYNKADYYNDITGKFYCNKVFIKKIILLGVCFLPVIHAVAFTYLQFHSIATMSHLSDIKGVFPRFIAYLFDLNFGIIVYHHLLFCIFFIFLFFWFFKKNWDDFFLGIAFLFTVILYSIMVHINCGMEGIARYSVWSSPVMLFPVVKQLSSFGKRIFSCIPCIIYFLLNLIILFYIPLSSGHMYWSKTADFCFRHFPALYKPLYSTFISRTIHIDGGYNDYIKPEIYRTGKTSIILCSKQHLNDFWKFFYVSDQKVYDELEVQRHNFMQSNSDFFYFHTQREIVPVLRKPAHGVLHFNITDKNTFYCVHGFPAVEPWGTWSDGKEAEMYVALPDKKEQYKSMKLTLRPFLSKKGKQEVEIKINDQLVKKVIFTAPQDQEIVLPIPENAEKFLKFNFTVSDPTSPAELGMSADGRKLGFGLISLKYGK